MCIHHRRNIIRLWKTLRQRWRRFMARRKQQLGNLSGKPSAKPHARWGHLPSEIEDACLWWRCKADLYAFLHKLLHGDNQQQL